MITREVNNYSRINAANYAIRFAMKPNPAYRYFSLDNTGGDCANFLSQCLLAGGASMNSSWWYRHNTWSLTWTVAHSLYWYLKKNAASNLPGPKGIEVSNINLLELGDFVFLEDNRGTIFHSAIVTYKDSSQTLISHHSFEALNISYLNSWPFTKAHFVKIKL